MRNKVLFVIFSIYGGGAEKQMQYILKYIDRNKFEPHLAVFHITGKEKKVVPSDVPVYDLSTKLRPASFFLIFKLRKLVKKIRPEKILSFTWGVNLLSIIAGWKAEVFVSERNTASRNLPQYSFHKIRKVLILIFYKKASKVIACAEFVQRDLIKNFNIPQDKIRVVCNAVDIENIREMKEEFSPGFVNYVLGCGRLVAQKNFEFLVTSAADIKMPLVIIGEGHLREELAETSKAMGAELALPGFIENPYPYFRGAKVFCLTSRYEGLPNVILEAMACGCPVVSVDCPGGIRDIIEHEIDGLIVPMNDKAALASAVMRLSNDGELRERLVKNALKKIKEKFGIERMVTAYEGLLLSENCSGGDLSS